MLKTELKLKLTIVYCMCMCGTEGERVIVVTHGGVLRAIYLMITKASSARKLLNASVNVVHYREEKWIIDSWSDVSHLSSVGFLQRGFDGDSKP